MPRLRSAIAKPIHLAALVVAGVGYALCLLLEALAAWIEGASHV